MSGQNSRKASLAIWLATPGRSARPHPPVPVRSALFRCWTENCFPRCRCSAHRQMPVPIFPRREERGPDHMFRARPEPALRRREVARIIFPQAPDRGFDGIARRNAGQAHAVTLPEAFPVRVIFVRFVAQNSQSCAEWSIDQQAHGAGGGSRKPTQPSPHRHAMVVRNFIPADFA